MKLAMIASLLFTLFICNVNSQSYNYWYHDDVINDSAALYSVKYSPDGTKLATGGSDDLVKIYDVYDDNSLLQTLVGHGNPDVPYFVGVWTLDFSPDSTTLVSGARDNTLKIWDVDSGDLIRTLEGHTSWVESAVFSPDGNTIVSVANDCFVKVWDVATGELMRTLNQSGNCYTIDYSPDSNTFAVNSSDRIIVYNAFTYAIVASIDSGQLIIYSIAFNHDGTKLAAGGLDRTIRVWGMTNYELLHILSNGYNGHSDTIRAIAFNHDGTLLASGGNDDTLKLWNVDDEYCFQTLTGHFSTLASVDFNYAGNSVASASYDQSVQVSSIPPPPDCDSDTEEEVLIRLITDNYPLETSWTLGEGCDVDGTKLFAGGILSQYSKSTAYETYSCLPKGEAYTFKIRDTAFDGLCCQYGSGSYYISIGDESFTGGNFDYSVTHRFGPLDSEMSYNGKDCAWVAQSSDSRCGLCRGNICAADYCKQTCSPCPIQFDDDLT